MVPEPQHDTDPLGLTPSSARCHACGRRIAGSGAGCPVHGRTHSSGAPLAEASHVALTAYPSFPGYRVTRLLGHGGFGLVYGAEPATDGPSVAIKVARRDRPDAASRLTAEIDALIAVGPPHVPEVFERGALPDGTPFVVMEQLDAPTLADRLLIQGGPMPLTEAVSLVQAALVALAAIHARGFVHRDLKPENVFVDGALQAKIVDLGLAFAVRDREVTSDGGVSSDRTLEGTALGTAEYMAPEQCEGLLDVDARTDIYTAGVVLYELLAGRPPFWGPAAIVQQCHRGQRPPRLSGLVPVPPGLEAIVHRCLAKDRDDRYPSAEALRDALRDALAVHAREADRVLTPATMFLPALEHEPPTESKRAAALAGDAGRERRRVGILHFRSKVDVIAVQRRLLSLGAELAYASGDRFVAIYSHEVGDNPARRALRAGRELVKVGVCDSALVDLAAVSVQVRPDGGRRFWSPLFAQAGRFAEPQDPGGVFTTIDAAAAIPELAGSVPSERGWVSTEGVLATARSDTHAGLEGRALVGRDDVVAALIWGARRTVARAMPTAAVVIAEAGHGKSHLGQVLLDQLGGINLRAEVIDLRARPPDFGDADRTLRELLQRAIGVPSAAPPEAVRGLLEQRLGPERSPLDTAILAFSLGWIGASAPELRALTSAPGALRPAMATSAGEALRRRARRGPIFVVLDDAHHADETTLAALEYAALADAGAPIWICALGRPTFEAAHPSWGDRAASRELHRLGPLDPASAAELCRKLLLPAESVPEPAVAHLIARTQAVPLLLVELVRGLKRAGVVRRHPRGESWFLATDELDRLPDLPLIEWLAQTEMDQLSPSLRAHARLVALLGGDATGAEIDGVLRRLDQSGAAGDLPLDARVGTRRLLSAGLLVQHREGRIGFRHALVREAIAAGTPAAPAHRIHLAAAEYYRDAHAIPEERRLLQLASHAAAAGLGAVAEGAYLKLAESAQARHAYMEAERLYSGALAAVEAQITPPPGPSGPQAPASASARALLPRRGRGRMRQRLGRYDDALADFSAAHELARATGDTMAEVEILLDEATTLDWMNDYARSEACVIAAETLARERGLASPTIEASLLLGLGRSRHRYSREDEAAPLIELAAELAQHLGDDGYETRVISLLMLGFINQGTGRLDAAARVLDEAVALSDAHQDRVHLFAAVNVRAMLRACLGDKAGMVAGFTHALALARELGQPMLEIICHYNLGELLYLMDDLDAAEPHVSKAIQLERARVGADSRAEVTLLDARVHLYRGQETEARILAIGLRRASDEAKAEARRDPLQVPSEDVLCTMIDLATRDADDAEWDALEQRSTLFSVGQEHLEVLEARALAALRRRAIDAARAQILRAIEAATRIPNVMGDRLRRALDATTRA